MEQDYKEISSQLILLVSSMCRDKFVTPPHCSQSFCVELDTAVSKYAFKRLRKQEGEFKFDFPSTLEFVSGSVIQPLEFSHQTQSTVISHCVGKIISIIEKVYYSHQEKKGVAEIEFGVGVWGSGNRLFVCIGIFWRSPALLRRKYRKQNGIIVNSSNLLSVFIKELQSVTLEMGLGAKYCEEFEYSLKNDDELILPSLFSDYDILELNYDSNILSEDILDHAISNSIPHVTHVADNEFDPHISVALTNPTASSIKIQLARLWRNKIQYLQTLPKIPTYMNSRELEVLIKEQVCIYNGLEIKFWSNSLCSELFRFYSKGNSTDANGLDEGDLKTSSENLLAGNSISLPDGCDWVSHTAFTFYNWPLKAIISYISHNRIWNSAQHTTFPPTVIRLGISLIQKSQNNKDHSMTNMIHLNESEHSKYVTDNTPSPISTLIVACSIAWSNKPTITTSRSISYSLAGSYTNKNNSVLVEMETSANRLEAISHKFQIDQIENLDDMEYLVSKISNSSSLTLTSSNTHSTDFNPQESVVDFRMSIDHYHIDPKVLSPKSRDSLWPTLITNKLYLSGEIPSNNPKILSDYRISNIVVCSPLPVCSFSSINYLKISTQLPFNAQFRAFVSFVTPLLKYSSVTSNDSCVLIHDVNGTNLSAGLVIGYLMYKNDLSLEDSIHYIKARRSSVELDLDIFESLEKIEKSGFGFLSKTAQQQ